MMINQVTALAPVHFHDRLRVFGRNRIRSHLSKKNDTFAQKYYTQGAFLSFYQTQLLHNGVAAARKAQRYL